MDHRTVREENIVRFGAALEELKCGRLPAKFGSAKEDLGPMRTKYQTTAAGAAAEEANRIGSRQERRPARKVQTTLSFKADDGVVDLTDSNNAGNQQSLSMSHSFYPNKRRWGNRATK